MPSLNKNIDNDITHLFFLTEKKDRINYGSDPKLLNFENDNSKYHEQSYKSAYFINECVFFRYFSKYF